MVTRTQKVSVYKRQDKLFFATASQTEGRYGLWIDSGPHFVATVSDAPRTIGTRLTEALEASRAGAVYPGDPSVLERPLLDLAGVKSWETFMKGSSLYHVERDGDGIRIVPTLSDGSGFTRRTDSAITLKEATTHTELGEALLRAIAQTD